MKKLILITFLALFAYSAQAQTWEYFWHPRNNVEATKLMYQKAALPLEQVNSPFEWMFKPTFQVSATAIRPVITAGATGGISTLSAAGPALTLQHTGVAADGSNYADYSFNTVFLMTSDNNSTPFFKPLVAITVGMYNNVVNVGAGYDIFARDDGLSRFAILISIGVNLTNN
jgi:hypothetical protein